MDGGRWIEKDDGLEVRQSFAEGKDLVRMVPRDHGHPAAGMCEAEFQIGGFIDLHRERDIDPAGIEDAEFGHDPVIAAFGNEGDPVAFPESESEESGRAPVDEFTCLQRRSCCDMCRRAFPT